MSDDVKALRGKFELMTEISEKLTRASLYFYKPNGVYVAKTMSDDDQFDCDFVNGAWYAFQEQQQRITVVKSILNRIYAETEGDDALLMKYLDEIQEVLK